MPCCWQTIVTCRPAAYVYAAHSRVTLSQHRTLSSSCFSPCREPFGLSRALLCCFRNGQLIRQNRFHMSPRLKNIVIQRGSGRSTLQFVIRLNQKLGPSHSSANTLFATSSGFHRLGRTSAFFILNCFCKRKRALNLAFAPLTWKPLGSKGVTCMVDRSEKILRVEVCLATQYGLTKSGNLIIIASTGGSRSLGRSGITLGLSVFHHKLVHLRLSELDLQSALTGNVT